MESNYGPIRLVQGDGVGYPVGYRYLLNNSRPETPAYIIVGPIEVNRKKPTEAEKPIRMPMNDGAPATAKERAERTKLATRSAAGKDWVDPTLLNWDASTCFLMLDDYRIFVGDLDGLISDNLLYHAFSVYGSILKARVVRDKVTGLSKGYGFVSFRDPGDYSRAMKDMQGKYLGNRPCNLRKSTWRDRAAENKESFTLLKSANLEKKLNTKY